MKPSNSGAFLISRVEKEGKDEGEIFQKELMRLAEIERHEIELKEAKKLSNRLTSISIIPNRNYLMNNIIPILSEGMVDISRIIPVDPVDFLSEYLLKKSNQL